MCFVKSGAGIWIGLGGRCGGRWKLVGRCWRGGAGELEAGSTKLTRLPTRRLVDDADDDVGVGGPRLYGSVLVWIESFVEDFEELESSVRGGVDGPGRITDGGGGAIAVSASGVGVVLGVM